MKKESARHAKGWGYEDWYRNEPDYCAKGLHFRPGGRFSLHFHLRKHETWIIARGTFQLEIVDPKSARRISTVLRVGDHQCIPPGTPHRLTNLGKGWGWIIECSTQHFEEDSYRIEPGDSQKKG